MADDASKPLGRAVVLTCSAELFASFSFVRKGIGGVLLKDMESLAQVTMQLKGAVTDSLFIIGPVVKKIGLVMCGGSLGAVSRYGVSLLSIRIWGTGFPWGTLIVNLMGCFLIGVLFTLAARARLLTPDMRLLLITGYMGALTTFSTFALETVNAGRAGMLLQSLTNVLANNVGGLACTFLGIWVASLIR